LGSWRLGEAGQRGWEEEGENPSKKRRGKLIPYLQSNCTYGEVGPRSPGVLQGRTSPKTGPGRNLKKSLLMSGGVAVRRRPFRRNRSQNLFKKVVDRSKKYGGTFYSSGYANRVTEKGRKSAATWDKDLYGSTKNGKSWSILTLLVV